MSALSALFWKHSVSVLMAGIAAAILALFVFDSVGMPETGESDFSPYVLCTQGTTVVKRSEERITLPKEMTAKIVSGDQIKTLPNSSATVFWADGSITRLSEKTTVEVNELAQASNASPLRVDFSLSEGKTWSRTYRYLPEGASFAERFDDGRKLAAVRGTAFEINAEKWYLRTESHAVEISDPSGNRLATVPEGIAVSASDLSAFVSALDSAWKDSNLRQDLEYSAEQSKRVKAQLLARYADSVSKASSVRSFFGQGEKIPVSISFSGDSLVVSVPEDFASRSKDSKALMETLSKAYEQTAALSEDPTTIRSKEALRDAILQLSPPERKASLATLFARHEIYDSWSQAAKEGGDDELLRIRKKIRGYVSEGADAEVLRDLELALPKAKIDAFNAKMENLKRRGFEALSQEDLFPLPSETVVNAIEKIRESGSEMIETAIDSIR